MGEKTIVLYRPVGNKELELIRDSGSKSFPPRLPHQPIFYPVLTESYAVAVQVVAGSASRAFLTPSHFGHPHAGHGRRLPGARNAGLYYDAQADGVK